MELRTELYICKKIVQLYWWFSSTIRDSQGVHIVEDTCHAIMASRNSTVLSNSSNRVTVMTSHWETNEDQNKGEINRNRKPEKLTVTMTHVFTYFFLCSWTALTIRSVRCIWGAISCSVSSSSSPRTTMSDRPVGTGKSGREKHENEDNWRGRRWQWVLTDGNPTATIEGCHKNEQTFYTSLW